MSAAIRPSHLLKTILPAAIALMIIAVTATAIAGERLNGLAAVVNGQVITRSEVNNEVMAQRVLLQQQYKTAEALRSKIEEIKSNVLDALIDRELILAEFAKNGGAIRAEFIDDRINTIIRERYKDDRQAFLKDLSRAGMSLKEFRTNQEKKLVASYMRGQQAQSVEPPTWSEIEKFYKDNQADFRADDFVKLRTLTIPKYSGSPNVTPAAQKKLGGDLRTQLVNGADFATLARTHSTDSAAEQGGDRGWLDKQSMNAEMATAAFSIEEGGISDIIESATSYTIMWVEARRNGKVTPLEEVRDAVEARVKAQKGKELERKWLDRLRRNAVIKRFD